MTTFVGVIGALLTKAQGAVDPTVRVFDGPPMDELQTPICYLVLGSALAETTGESVGEPELYMGGDFSMRESYDLVGYVRAETGDSDVTWCRNAVVTAFQAFRAAVLTDRQLGGALTGGDWIVPGGWQYLQTSDEDLADPAGDDIFAHISFRFTVTTLIQP